MPVDQMQMQMRLCMRENGFVRREYKNAREDKISKCRCEDDARRCKQKRRKKGGIKFECVDLRAQTDSNTGEGTVTVDGEG